MNRDALLAVGVSLVVAGIILRGVARSNRRDQALRKQHHLDDRTASDETDRADRHLEKYLPRYAAGCITIGLTLVIASFFHR